MTALHHGEGSAAGLADPHAVEKGPGDFFAFLVFLALAAHLMANRLIPDVFVLPVGLSVRPWEPLLALLALAWLTWLIVQPKSLPRGALGLVALALFVVLVFAYFWNAPGYTQFEMDASRRGLMRVFLYAGLFMASFHLAGELRLANRILTLIPVLTAVQAVIAIFEYLLQRRAVYLYHIWTGVGLIEDPNGIRRFSEAIEERPTGLPKVQSTAPHPITLSALLALGVLLTVALYLHAPTKKQRRLYLLLLIPQLLALPFTNSRTGFFILILAGLVMALLQIRKWPRALHLALGLTGIMGLALVVSPGTARLLLNSLTQPEQDPNIVVRVDRAELVPELMADRPLLGSGYITTDVGEVLFDNAYYLGLVEFGVLGLLLLVTFFLLCFSRSFVALGRANPDEQPVVLAGALGVLCLLAGGATFDAWTFDQFFPTCLILLGLGAGRADVVLRDHRPTRRHLGVDRF